MSGLTMCPSCQAAVPSGHFCAVCGAALQGTQNHLPSAAQPAVPVSESRQMQPAADGPNTSQALPVAQAAVPVLLPRQAAAPTVVPSAVSPGALAGPPSVARVGEPPSGARLPRHGRQQATVGGVLAVVVVAGFVVFGMGGKHTVTGDITLTGSGATTAGSFCEGDNGYDDITGGAEVRVKDENGTLVGTGRLQDGTSDGVSCVFMFTVKDVPRASYYEISAGNDSRGGVHFSPDELSSEHWSAHLTLGD